MAQGQAHKFVTDVAARGLFQVLNALKGLLYLPLMSKQFGAQGYGIWSQIIITIALFAPTLTLRLDGAIVRYLGGGVGSHERRKGFFSSSIVVWLLSLAALGVGLLMIHPIAQVMFGDTSLALYAALFLGLLVTRVNLGFALSYYRAISAIRLYSGLQGVQIAADLLALTLLTVAAQRGLAEGLIAFIIVDMVLLIVVLVDIIRRNGVLLQPDWILLKKYLRYSLPLVPAVALYWVVNSSDRYVIVHFLGLNSVGVYSGAYRVAQVLTLLIQPISFVLLPAITQMWEKGEEDRARNYMGRSLRYYVMLAVPASAGLIAVGPNLLRLLGTAAFIVEKDLLAALVLGIFFVGLYQIVVYVLYLHEKTRLLIVIFFTVATLNLVMNIVLVPIIGILGAALTTCLSYFMQFIIVYRYSRRLFRIPVCISLVFKSMASSAIMYGVISLLPVSTILEIGIAAVIGATIYFLGMAVLRGISREDWREILRVVGRRE